ncbi:LPD7 domain-containing protein [Methylobacter sp.]|uniref:LPD7 domain-containing protein n=1 Tax=Methylobacter sp. TaxID=2051955 RepID=UPI003DA363A4
MDVKIGNQGGQELAARSKEILSEESKSLDAALAEQQVVIAERHGQPATPETEEGRKKARAEDATAKQSGLPESKLDTALAEQEAKVSVKEMGVDPAALERVAASRNREFAQVREAMGLNTVEPNIEKQQQPLVGEEEAKRAAWLKKGEQAKAVQAPSEKSASGNKVESDEIFTATQSDIKPVIPSEIEKQYLRVGDKFYHPKNTDSVAFEDKGNKLETKSNSENIAESMVRIAAARGWDEIKVSGSESFSREVWLEASSRGMQVKGYTPTEQDKAELAKRMRESEINKIEQTNKPFRARENDEAKEIKTQAEAPTPEVKANTPHQRMADSFAKDSPEETVKKHPELAGAAALAAAMDKKAQTDGLSPAQREVVAARVRQNLVNSIERGNIPEIKIKEEKTEVVRSTHRKEEREYGR